MVHKRKHVALDVDRQPYCNQKDVRVTVLLPMRFEQRA